MKFGALATPFGFDWDGDGDTDLICGNTRRLHRFHREPQRPRRGKAEVGRAEIPRGRRQGDPHHGRPERQHPGPVRGEVGLHHAVASPTGTATACPTWSSTRSGARSIWYRNIGTRTEPKLAAAQPIEVEWDGAAAGPGVGLAQAGGQGAAHAVAHHARRRRLEQGRPRRPRDARPRRLPRLLRAGATRDGQARAAAAQAGRSATRKGAPLRLNAGAAGKSGRRKFCLVDWDGDGRLDLLLNAANARLLRQVDAGDGRWRFRDAGLLSETDIEGHDVSPTVVDFNGDGIPDFLGGAEDGHFYYLRNPRTKAAEPRP